MSGTCPRPRFRMATGWVRGKALTISDVHCERRGPPRRSRSFCRGLPGVSLRRAISSGTSTWVRMPLRSHTATAAAIS